MEGVCQAGTASRHAGDFTAPCRDAGGTEGSVVVPEVTPGGCRPLPTLFPQSTVASLGPVPALAVKPHAGCVPAQPAWQNSQGLEPVPY